MKNDVILYYIHDPMCSWWCSWCYGFKPVLESLTQKLKDRIKIQYLLGGLAPDTENHMPESMKNIIRSNWERIEETIPDIKFNYLFWKKCTPKRSTYASCRAVISAKKQSNRSEISMINAIQKAYYQEARNPSEYRLLYELADEIGLDKKQFIKDIHSNEVNDALLQQIKLCRQIGTDSFPSLYIFTNQTYYPVVLDYNNAGVICEHIESYIHHEK